MADYLLRTRCDKGHIEVYEDKVVVGYDKMGYENSQTILKSNITGIDVKTKTPAFLGKGGAADVTIYSTGDQKLELKFVKPKDAKQIKELLAN